MSPQEPDRSRFPAAVYGRGLEPDARFSLANERTFLAWIRTALGLLAGGVALEVLALDLHAGLRLAASLVLIIAGVLLPLLAWGNWARTEHAIRTKQTLPGSVLGLLLAITVSAAGMLVILAVILR
jgi:putative membrane protein